MGTILEACQSSNTLTETLQPRKSAKHRAMRFDRVSARVGRLTIQTGSVEVVYRVDEFDADLEGRAFRLTKIKGGTDKEARGYDVLCGEPYDQCECRGFLGTGRCKHIDSCRVIVSHDWMTHQVPADLPFSTPAPRTITVTRSVDGVQIEFRAVPPERLGGRSYWLESRELQPGGTPYSEEWFQIDAEYSVIISLWWPHGWELCGQQAAHESAPPF